MGTYNLTKGAAAIANLDHNKHFVAHIPIVVADIIAANTTLTANAKITAADVIQIWDIPANTVIKGGILEILIAGTASNTIDVGIAGSNELFDNFAIDGAVGTHTINTVAVGWGPDNVAGVVFSSTDTLDVTFAADEIIGSFVLHVEGYVIY